MRFIHQTVIGYRNLKIESTLESFTAVLEQYKKQKLDTQRLMVVNTAVRHVILAEKIKTPSLQKKDA